MHTHKLSTRSKCTVRRVSSAEFDTMSVSVRYRLRGRRVKPLAWFVSHATPKLVVHVMLSVPHIPIITNPSPYKSSLTIL
ncbi:Orf16 [Heliothis zea nudivirus]|uniref:Orf16 n=1 Tax=Heliothis zea nudivirus 1 TaxID=3116536 RepID=Q8JKU5_9VIRU|nr:Orf16 [Heliothis zea nudivirus]AAN04311.1 Orf16 [Heliothis zea nudivirus]